MRALGYFDGAYGKICIIEDKATGARRYYEGNAFQSHAHPNGESCFTYIHLMNAVLQNASNVLLLGCAGGTLATMLHQQGKHVTLVDRNPLSFQIAQEYFWMPPEIQCVTADFKDFIKETTQRFDGLAIDVGGPDFAFEAEFDAPTCKALRRLLARDGRMTMNILVENNRDALTDLLAHSLAGLNLNAWIIDEAISEPERNAIIACTPEDHLQLPWHLMPPAIAADVSGWRTRRPRPGGLRAIS